MLHAVMGLVASWWWLVVLVTTAQAAVHKIRAGKQRVSNCVASIIATCNYECNTEC